MKRLAILLFTLIGIPALAQTPATEPAAEPVAAAEPAKPGRTRDISALVRMHLDFGGTELIQVEWTDGDSSTLKAGQLITFSAGALYRSPTLPFSAEATIGYKFDRVNGSNGSIMFTRFPLELLAAYMHGAHRIGLGGTVHLLPSFDCDAAGLCSSKVDYGPAIGGIVQYAYSHAFQDNSGLDFGLRYTLIRYTGPALANLDGSAFGLFFGGFF